MTLNKICKFNIKTSRIAKLINSWSKHTKAKRDNTPFKICPINSSDLDRHYIYKAEDDLFPGENKSTISFGMDRKSQLSVQSCKKADIKSVDVRRVDLVLAYEPDDNEDHVRMRNEFEKLIGNSGLLMDKFVDEYNDIVYLKLFIPSPLMKFYAEKLKFIMPLKIVNRDWVQLIRRENLELHVPVRFWAPFVINKENMFDMSLRTDTDSPFTGMQKALVVSFILAKFICFISDKGNDLGQYFSFDELIKKQVYTAAYIPHETTFTEEGPRKRLKDTWASFRFISKPQPISEIKDYFGAKVAIYFAWYGFYTYWLGIICIPAILVGLYGMVTVGLYVPANEICNKTYDQYFRCPVCDNRCNFTRFSYFCDNYRLTYLTDNIVAVSFSVLMSIWSVFFLEQWNIYASQITFLWNTPVTNRLVENPRIDFLKKYRNQKHYINVLTNLSEPKIDFLRHKLFSYLMTCVFLGICFCIIFLFVIIINAFHRFAKKCANNIDHTSSLSHFAILSTLSPSFLNWILMRLFEKAYHRISYKLTTIEAPRTKSEFESSFIVKLASLNFVNAYGYMFYVAFMKDKAITDPGYFLRKSIFFERCDNDSCHYEIMSQIVSIMMFDHFQNAFLQLVLPYLKVWYRNRNPKDELSSPKKLFTRSDSNDSIGFTKSTTTTTSSTSTILSEQTPSSVCTKTSNYYVAQWETDYILNDFEESISMLDEYRDAMLQFGFVTLFINAFPLAPVFACIFNILKLRIDAIKLTDYYKRPIPQSAKSIGTWETILHWICRLSVLSNALIIAFSSDFIPQVVYMLENGTMVNYINSTLSFYDARKLSKQLNIALPEGLDYCAYHGYKYPPWQPNHQQYTFNPRHWKLMVYRVAFVLTYQNLVYFIGLSLKEFLNSFENQIQTLLAQHQHLTTEAILSIEKDKIIEKYQNELPEIDTAIRRINSSVTMDLSHIGIRNTRKNNNIHHQQHSSKLTSATIKSNHADESSKHGKEPTLNSAHTIKKTA